MCYAGYMQQAYNLIGGRICLDFCNTFSGDDRVAGNDQWSSYDDLIAWGLVLGAREVLPRSGYAKSDALRPAGFGCQVSVK